MFEDGVWRTVGGRRIFIRNGQALSEAMKASGKFKTEKKTDEKLKRKAQEANDKWFKDKVNEWTKEVEKRASNDLKPFKKEEVDAKKISDRAGNISKEDLEECLRVTDEVYKNAEMHEPVISRDLINSAEATGSKMYGLDFRMKQPNSLAGKIIVDAEDEKLSYRQAGAKIKDAVRYTVIVDDKNFVSKYNQIKSSLEAKGYKEDRLKNFYKMYEEGTQCQKAIQCVYSTKDGYKFELQYHTYNSQGAKEVNHPLYEEYRKADTSEFRKSAISNTMRNQTAPNVNNPEGILGIESHG